MKTLKKLLFIIMAVAVLAMPVFGVQAAESDIPVTEQPGVSPTPSPVPIRELVTKGNKIYYYYKGKMVKNKWKRYNGYKYYFGANGNAVRGGQRINNVVYVFDEKGRLFENKQNKIVKSGSNIYHIRTEHGRASIGYFIYKNNLYYADPKGRLYQKKSRQNGQLYFTNSGAARKDYNALLKMRVMQIVSSITNSGMSQSQKLYACWKYVVYGGFYYGGPDPNIYQSGWARSEALRMFRTGYGNCYGFSCIFAALAREIGYTPYMICGRVNFVGRYVPPAMMTEPTAEEQAEIDRINRIKDRRHQQYLRRKESGWQRKYEERVKNEKRAKMQAMKEEIRRQDRENGVYATAGSLALEPTIGMPE